MGGSHFDFKSNGTEPHIDHMYPRHALLTKLGPLGSEVNALGNCRFVGATDDVPKLAELPARYFGRLKAAGTPIEEHLLLEDFASDMNQLVFDAGSVRTLGSRGRVSH